MHSTGLKVLFALWAFLFIRSSFGQQKERKEPEFSSRDLSDMFYTDTLTPKKTAPATTNPKQGPSGSQKQVSTAGEKQTASLSQKPVATAGPKHLGAPAHPPSDPMRRVGLKYRIQLCTSGCNIQEVDPSHTFSSGDRIRLLVESNIDGYLYVLDKQSSGVEQLLFPHPEINGGTNWIERGIQFSIPHQSGDWFMFKEPPGEERLTIIVSRTPLRSLPQEIPSQVAPPISLFAVMRELDASVRSRDLVLVTESAPLLGSSTKASPVTQATIVVNSSENQNNQVYTEITLRHR